MKTTGTYINSQVHFSIQDNTEKYKLVLGKPQFLIQSICDKGFM